MGRKVNRQGVTIIILAAIASFNYVEIFTQLEKNDLFANSIENIWRYLDGIVYKSPCWV